MDENKADVDREKLQEIYKARIDVIHHYQKPGKLDPRETPEQRERREKSFKEALDKYRQLTGTTEENLPIKDLVRELELGELVRNSAIDYRQSLSQPRFTPTKYADEIQAGKDAASERHRSLVTEKRNLEQKRLGFENSAAKKA